MVGFLTVKVEGYIQQEKEARMIHALKDSAGDNRTKSYLPLHKQMLHREIITDVHTYVCVCAQLPSCIWLFVTPCAEVRQVLCPWNFPAKDTRVGCHFLLQGIVPTQGSNPCLLCVLHWQMDSLPLHHLESLYIS